MLEPWLMVPLTDPQTVPEKRFNESFKKTRCIVERCIGLWKTVFKCIDKAGGVLQYKPEKCCKIITASAVLHNLRRRCRLEEDEVFMEDEEGEDNEHEPPPPQQQNAIQIRGIAVRNEIIRSHFT